MSDTSFVKRKRIESIRVKDNSTSDESDKHSIDLSSDDSYSDDRDKSQQLKLNSKFKKTRNIISTVSKEKQTENIIASRVVITHSSETHRTSDKSCGATKHSEIETERDRDAQAIFERHLQMAKDNAFKEDDKVYRGQAGYARYIEKKDNALGGAASNYNRQGPMRTTTNIRLVTRWDYEPDICKDYHETGFCGFGDSCKYLHDRSDFKSGWELEQEYERGIYGKKNQDVRKYQLENFSDNEKSEEEEELPFACHICRRPFVDPIVTKCKHYFCEKCALDRYHKESKRCALCESNTFGVFLPAKNLQNKINIIRHKMVDESSSSSSSISDSNDIEQKHTNFIDDDDKLLLNKEYEIINEVQDIPDDA